MNNENGQEKKEPFVFEVNTKKTNQPYVFNASSGQGLIDEIDNSYQRSQPANPQPVNNVQVQNNQPVNPQPVNNAQVQNDQIAAQQQMLLQELYSEEPEGPKSKKKSSSFSGYGKIALILSFIPIILFIFCFIYSGGSSDESGEGAIWWFLILYYWSFGVPLLITSIVLAIIGLKKDIITKPAKVSLFLDAAPLFFLLIIIIF